MDFVLHRLSVIDVPTSLPELRDAENCAEGEVSFMPIKNWTDKTALIVRLDVSDDAEAPPLSAPLTAARSRAEEIIWQIACTLSIATQRRVQVESLHPHFMISRKDRLPISNDLASWVILDLPAQALTFSQTIPFNLCKLGLADRADAATLLSHAIAIDDPISRIIVISRIFENAFSKQHYIDNLFRFLSVVDLEYTVEEIGAWNGVRGASAHADFKKASALATETQASRILYRMTLAAYDVVFNKLNWHSPDLDRRAFWEPDTWGMSKIGHVRGRVGSPFHYALQIVDPFTGWKVSNASIQAPAGYRVPKLDASLPMQCTIFRTRPEDPEPYGTLRCRQTD